jgi:hypothetical protein
MHGLEAGPTPLRSPTDPITAVAVAGVLLVVTVQQNMRQAREYERSMHRFFKGEPVALKQPRDRYPSREELYARGRLR